VPTKILVADDSATMRRVLEMTFAGEDARVLTVDSGDAALSKAAELMPDIIFADASMPGVDGYEVARRIKTNPQLAKVAVIVMASQHTPYDDGKGRAAGVDDHIPKPFDTASVIDRVAQVLARPRNVAAGAAAAAAPAAPPPAPRPAAIGAPPPPAQRSAVGNATRMGIGAPIPAPPARPAPIPAAASAAAAAPQPIRSAAPAPAPVAAAAAPAAVRPAPAPQPAPATTPAVAPVDGAVAGMAQKLGQLGLSKEQIEGVLALSREVVEQVVWEVVPVLAEQLIKEEIKRLTAD
jgi:CheY-like chemotaxis protein